MQKKKVTETRRFGSSGTKPGKRLLAMLLTLILACSMLPTAALAENAAAEPDGVSPAPADGETSGETLDVAHTASAAQPGEYLLGAELGAEPEPETPSTETPESEAETPSAGTVRETETPSAGTPGQEGDDLGSTEAPEALTPTNEGRGNTPSELAPMAAPSDIGTLAAGDYNAGDIAVINAIIDNNGLQWTKASPADGSFIPADWWPETSAGPGITWSEDATDKRIRILRIYSQNLTGTLNVSGLAELINLNCLNNQLTGVNVSGNTSLDYLNCSNNWLTALDVSNNTSLSYLTCTNNGLTALDVSHCRLYSLDLNENPLQSIKLSDRSEIRIATEPAGAGTVVVTDFKWDSIAQDFTLLAYDGDDNDDKGFRQWTYGFENLPTTTEFDNPATFRHYGSVIMIVTAHFGDLPIYDLGDIAVVNELIDNGVLPWERAPEDGSAIPDNWDGMSWSSSTYHKRLTGWTIYPELSGTVKLSGLTALRTLVCNNNEHTSLDVSGCVALTSLTCNNNLKLKSLDISGCTALQTVNFNNNSLVILRLTGGTVHIDVPEPLWGTVRTAGFSASEKKLSLTATAQSGYTFTGWTGIDADTMTANPVAFVVSGTMNVTANFAPVLYHPDDVAVINTLIAHNNLGWTPVSANGTTHPIDWTGVTWSDDARYKRIRALDLSDCSLEGAADISGLAALTSLDCSRNELASLDVSGCAVLETLDLNGNPLRHLKLQDGNELQIGIVSQDDASQDDATVRVTAFTLSDRSITLKAEGGEAGLQNWRGLDSTAGSKDNPVTFTIVGVMSVTAYFVSYSAFDIAVINRVIENNGLEWTKASPADGSYVPNDWGGVSWSGDTLDKQITSLSINTNNSAQKDLTGALDLSGLVALTYLNCDANQLVSLDVSGCVALTELRCSSNQLASLDIVGCTALDGLYCFDNQLESLDVSGLKALRYLYGYNNQLTSLKVSGCTALVRLYCYNNRLVDLDVSGLDALFDFRCYDNQLESLDVSGLDALDDLECYDNQLTSLDVSGLKALTQIVCDNNKLTSLDVSDCAVLRYLKCENNQLATLDLSGLAALRSLYCVGNPVQNLILPAGHELLTAVDPEGSGTVYVAQIDASLLYPAVPVNNAWVTLTATPESGYAFKEWTWTGVENASVTGNSVRFQIPSQNMTVTAHFRGLPYHPDDVALINGIILNNGLDWTLASPADGTAVPSDWTGVQWSSDARFKQITSLDISGCDLKGALDVSGLVELKALDCDGNRLTGLDVSGCAALEALSLSGNPLQTLKLQDGDELQIEVLPSGGGTVMTGAFNLSTKGLTLTAIAEGGGSFTGWTGAAVSTTNPVSFNISGNMTVTAGFESSLYHVGDIAVINAIIEDNGLNWTKADPADGSSIPSDWVSGLSRVVWSTDTLNKRIMSLDISGRTLTGALDVSGLTALTALYCSNNQFTSLDVSGCRALSYLSCAGNQLVSLDVSGCDALSTLSCGSNLLTSLDVSDCRTLNILECQNNQLTSLKLSINLALRQLLCQDNQLTSLDVSKNSALRYLYCQNNQLTSLDVSMLPVWSGSASTYGLSCAGNPLQSLKLQAGNELYLPVSPSGTGAVHVSTFNYGANANSIVYLTATAESGCNFTGWTGAVSGTDNPIRLTLSGSMTVTANFEGTPTPVLYTLTVTGGTGSGSYEAGTVVPVSAGTPPSGKVFDRWVLVGSGTIADATAFETTFTMTSANATLEAMYEDVASPTINALAIRTQPDRLSYAEGDTLDLSGLVLTLSYTDDTTEDVIYTDFASRGITVSFTGGAGTSHGQVLTAAVHDAKTITLALGDRTAMTDALSVALHAISLDQHDTHVFSPVTEGYDTRPAQVFTVTNTGNRPTGELTFSLTGDTQAFEMSPQSLAGIAVGSTGSFTVRPVSGLTAKTYDAQVSVGGSYLVTQSFGVRIVVGTPIPVFIPVLNITGVPDTATAGTPLTLSATVFPSDATNQTLVWTIQDAGGTGAVITGNTLETTSAGTLGITATVTGGAPLGLDYTQDFTIRIDAPTPVLYTLTVTGGTGSGSYEAGTVVPVSAGTPPSGKVFDRWVLVGSGTIADATAFETTFTMASANATLEAMYEDGGGNDNTGGNTGGNDGGNAGNSAGNNPANGTDTENNNATGTNMNNDVANAATGANDKENAQVINEPETPTTQGPSAQQGTQTEGGEAPEPSGFPWVMLIALSVAAVLATGGTLVFLRRRRNQQESH